MIKGQEGPSYERRLQELIFFSLGKLRRSGDMIALYKNTRGVSTMEGEELLKLKDDADTRTNGYKVAVTKFKLEIKEGFQPSKE